MRLGKLGLVGLHGLPDPADGSPWLYVGLPRAQGSGAGLPPPPPSPLPTLRSLHGLPLASLGSMLFAMGILGWFYGVT